MFRTGDKTDFARMLDDVLDEARSTSAHTGRRIQADAAAKGALHGRLHLAIEDEIKPTHTEAVNQAMQLIVQFAEETRLSIPDLCGVAKPKLTAFTSAIMEPIITVATRVFSAPNQQELLSKQIADVRARFDRRVDSAFQDVEVGFIQQQSVMNQPKTIQGNALRVLQAIYDRTRDQINPVFVTELNIGLGEEDSKAAWRYLRDKGLIKTFNLDYSACINAAGIHAIESAALHPDRPTSLFPFATYNVVNIGTAIHSPVQQAGALSTQSQVNTYDAQELSNLNRLVTDLTTHLHELNIDARQRQKAEAQIATIKAQLIDDEPDRVIVQQAGRTLRNITEGAIGSLLATAATQPVVWHWIQQTLASFR